MKLIFLLFFFVFPLTILCQLSEAEPVIISYKLPGASTDRQVYVSGNAYWNQEFKTGKIFLHGKGQKTAFLRYDAYRDRFEILKGKDILGYVYKDSDVNIILEREKIEYIEYLDHGNLKKGYFIPLNLGQTVLYLRRQKIIPEIELPEHGYEDFKPPAFEKKITYYLRKKDSPAKELNDLSRKEVFAVLWDKYSELRQYARKNRLYMRTEEEVIRVLAHYDSLKAKEDDQGEKSSD